MAAHTPSAKPDPSAARAVARARAAERRLGVRRIRTRVAALAATLFIAAFSTIYIQMAEGHDPALTATVSTSSGTTSSGNSTSSGSSGSTSGSGVSSASSSSDSSSSGSPSPSSVTTSQS